MNEINIVKRTIWVAALVSASLSTLPALQAQKRTAAGSSLTGFDYIEIQQLVAKYAYALDHDADGDAFAALFVADGVLGDKEGQHRGRAAIASVQLKESRSPAPVRHFTVNHLIEPSADGATGKEYFTTVRVGEGGKPNLEYGGHFEDTYIKTRDGWRFKSREVLDIGSGQQNVKWDPVRVPTAFGKEGAAPKGSLSVMDYIEIRQLVSQYSFVLDTGADNGYGYAGLFTSDGFFLAGNQGTQGVKYEGREKLAGLARGGIRGPANVANFISDVIIEPAPGGAIGKQYALAYDFKDGRPTAFRHDGDYEDVYAKTADGWRFKSRTFKSARRAANQAAPTAGAARPSADR